MWWRSMHSGIFNLCWDASQFTRRGADFLFVHFHSWCETCSLATILCLTLLHSFIFWKNMNNSGFPRELCFLSRHSAKMTHEFCHNWWVGGHGCKNPAFYYWFQWSEVRKCTCKTCLFWWAEPRRKCFLVDSKWDKLGRLTRCETMKLLVIKAA